MRRHYDNPYFGPRLLANGECLFRLWAPGARRVALVIEDSRPALAMAARNGWYRVTTDAIAGSRYRFLIDDNLLVPDPASRYQPDDVHGPSELIDPARYAWTDDEWRGRPWYAAVIYELHIGSFTPQGTFRAAIDRLPHLASLGITAIELMPVSDFPGARNWGYDGVLPYAPDSRYGRPEDLKALIDAAHGHGLMVLLDVVYNHFGPEGAYIHAYAPQFFTDRYHTPWGAAINFDGDDSRPVRDFFIHNALYWLEEYHLDGLRFDAVHAIFDKTRPDILEEIAQAVRAGPGRGWQIHLVLENDNNAAHYLAAGFDAQWNDDIHHALHVLLTSETSGYYSDYADSPTQHLGRCLTQGFAYQGEPSPYRANARRGEPSAALPLSGFVSFLQNHDQIGNRAFGERLTQLVPMPALVAATEILLLAPAPPLLFMGQEWGARGPFPFFCDFGPDLARAVTEGRRREFARFPEFSNAPAQARIPDPNAHATFQSAVLDWQEARAPAGADWLSLHRTLLQLRAREIVPRLKGAVGSAAEWRQVGERALLVHWRLCPGRLTLIANLGEQTVMIHPPNGRLLYHSQTCATAALMDGQLPAFTVAWFLEDA